MTSEFDILLDSICEDVFPKMDIHIKDNCYANDDEYVDVHEVIDFLTDVEGYDTDMANKIWECYLENRQYNLLHTKTDVAS